MQRGYISGSVIRGRRILEEATEVGGEQSRGVQGRLAEEGRLDGGHPDGERIALFPQVGVLIGKLAALRRLSSFLPPALPDAPIALLNLFSHMDPLLPTSEFPQLSVGGAAPPSLHNWRDVIAPADCSAGDLHLSHYPLEPEVIPFSGEKLSKGAEDLNLCLVGYSIGRRPYYEALLTAIKKTWVLKCSLQLLSLSDSFFLFKFACSEDMDMVYSRGVWFLLGKPFILQKWHPKFKPKRETLPLSPFGSKYMTFPLHVGIRKGFQGLQARLEFRLLVNKTRLTYARVCVLVDNQATYPEEITVSLDGDVVALKVQYEWKPSQCDHCKSLVHYSALCLSKPQIEDSGNPQTVASKPFPRRGRSKNRISRNKDASIPPPVRLSNKSFSPLPSAHSNLASDLPPISSPNSLGLPLHYQPHSHLQISYLIIKHPTPNYPLQRSLTSHCQAPFSPSNVLPHNKFEALGALSDTTILLDSSVCEDQMDKINKGKGKAQQIACTVGIKKSARGKHSKKAPI
ncbi:hypothetical protein M5K25_027660 [Dendrobium thyrsiflorum]|uniref:DUF4283 domain-containing protein n=1 Tax=Dendrobium thyrsiflorum TaxID=117978 RepID=A0ABD0TUE0_DENTH